MTYVLPNLAGWKRNLLTSPIILP